MKYNVNNENERIIIGEVGENLAESCTIDYSAWVEEYGEGNLRIRAIREGDAEPYPVANVETADGVATWTYTAADTAVKGFGEVQVLYYVGDVLAKSRVWKTYTYKSLNPSSEEVPDPYADWLNEVERIGGQVEADAEAASASADSASASATLAAGSASEAAESALSATRSESSAQEYASAASSSADSAASSATAASRSATEASNYEYNSEQYMNEAKSAKFGAESARTGAENAKAAAQASATAAAQSAAQAEDTAESIEASADLIQKLLANQIHDTATGTIASFPDGADMPMVSLVADIEPIQDTSGGVPSPSNICPISGWDSVDVVVSPTQDSQDGTTYHTTLPQTVYGGTLDVVSGVLTVDRAMVTFDGTQTSISVTPNFGSGYGRALFDTLRNTALKSYDALILSDIFTHTNDANLGLYKATINNNGILCLGIPPEITTVAEMTAWTQSNPFQLCYELDTPQTYQLTPTQIDSLLGRNNVWADSGDVTVEYIADTKLYIQKVIS